MGTGKGHRLLHASFEAGNFAILERPCDPQATPCLITIWALVFLPLPRAQPRPRMTRIRSWSLSWCSISSAPITWSATAPTSKAAASNSSWTTARTSPIATSVMRIPRRLPGTATIGTGAYTDGHGIGGNEWWDLARSKDNPVTSVEDERYALVGSLQGAKTTPGSSPRNLLASTVGDELRLDTLGVSQVYGISLKDRAAILPCGGYGQRSFLDRSGFRAIHYLYLLHAAASRLGAELRRQPTYRPGPARGERSSATRQTSTVW